MFFIPIKIFAKLSIDILSIVLFSSFHDVFHIFWGCIFNFYLRPDNREVLGNYWKRWLVICKCPKLDLSRDAAIKRSMSWTPLDLMLSFLYFFKFILIWRNVCTAKICWYPWCKGHCIFEVAIEKTEQTLKKTAILNVAQFLSIQMQ